MRRHFGNTEPESHLLGSDGIRPDLCTGIHECQLLRVGQVVGWPLRVSGRNEFVGITGNNDCKTGVRVSREPKPNHLYDVQEV